MSTSKNPRKRLSSALVQDFIDEQTEEGESDIGNIPAATSSHQ